MAGRQPKLTPCETCPFRVPMDAETWATIGRLQKEKAAPEYTDATNEHLTDVEREIHQGVEASVDQCQGYSMRRFLLGAIGDGIAGTGKLESTQNGGTRFVRAPERHCNNPFLDTPEYTELVAQLTRKAASELEAQQA